MLTQGIELVWATRDVGMKGLDLGGSATWTDAEVKANAANPLELGAPMPGLISRVLVCQGDKVISGQKLFTLEAMKMETTVCAALAGTVAEVALGAGAQVETGDLVVKLK